MVTPIIFLLAINCKKKECSSFNSLRDTAHQKSKTFAKHLTIFTVTSHFYRLIKLLKLLFESELYSMYFSSYLHDKYCIFASILLTTYTRI